MLKINTEKALTIAQERIRAWREVEFQKNDINLQNALVDGASTTQFIERRNWLRSLPQQCEGKTVEELKKFLLNLEQGAYASKDIGA